LDGLLFTVKYNKKENFTLPIVLVLSQMKYSIFLHPENTETVCLKILSHLCFSPTLFDLNYEHLNFGHL